MLAHREQGIQHQYALPGPRHQEAIVGNATTYVGCQLLVNILKRGRKWNARSHGKGKPMRLIWAGVGILPVQQYVHVLERRQLQRLKSVCFRRIDLESLTFLFEKLLQLLKVRLLRFGLQLSTPARRNRRKHDWRVSFLMVEVQNYREPPVAQTRVPYREAVKKPSPGLPRFAATLGDGPNDTNPDGVVSVSIKKS